MKIVVSGGGSGGHITPILAVVHHLKECGNTLHYIGTGAAQEQQLFAGGDLRMSTIRTGKFRRYQNRTWGQKLRDIKTPLLNLRDFFRFLTGFLQSLWLLLRDRPDRVFITGGYVGLPVGLAAWLLRIPLVIHELDTVPGLTNRLLSRLTKHRLSGFEMDGFIPVGNPVREDILRPTNLGRDHFGIQSEKPLLLVVGGSLGSEPINQVVGEFAKNHQDMEIIHVYGYPAPEWTHNYAHYHCFEFLSDDLAAALQLADVVVARTGANTLAELAALGKPTIAIPHPYLSGGHQVSNARAWADSLVVLPQEDLSVSSLRKTTQSLLENADKRQELAEAISRHSQPRAAALIADYIIRLKREDA